MSPDVQQATDVLYLYTTAQCEELPQKHKVESVVIYYNWLNSSSWFYQKNTS